MDKRSKALVACLIISTAAWIVQLAGVASLQAACEDDILPEIEGSKIKFVKGNLLNVRDLLLQQKNLTMALATQPQNLVSGLMQFIPLLLQSESEMLKAMSILTKRSAATIPPIFTPDHSCDDFYRWPWVTMSIQATVLVCIWAAFFTKHVRMVVVPGSTLIGMAICMSLMNGHTFFYIRHIGDDLADNTFARGKLFFAGCVFVIVGNVFTALVLGAWNELCEGALYPPSGNSSHHGELPTPVKDAPNGKTTTRPDNV